MRGQVRLDDRELRHLVGDLAGDDEDRQRGDGTNRVLGKGGDGQADRPERGHRRRHVEADEHQPQDAVGQRHGGPGQQCHGPDGEQGGAGGQRHGGHLEGDRDREHDDHGVLDGEQPGPPGRHGEQVAQRPVAGLAGDRVPGDHRDDHGHHQGEQQAERDEGEEDAVAGQLGDEGQAATAAAPMRVRREPQPDADDDREQRYHRQQQQVAPAQEDLAQLGSEEAQPRPGGPHRGPAFGAAQGRRSRPGQPGFGRPAGFDGGCLSHRRRTPLR